MKARELMQELVNVADKVTDRDCEDLEPRMVQLAYQFGIVVTEIDCDDVRPAVTELYNNLAGELDLFAHEEWVDELTQHIEVASDEVDLDHDERLKVEIAWRVDGSLNGLNFYERSTNFFHHVEYGSSHQMIAQAKEDRDAPSWQDAVLAEVDSIFCDYIFETFSEDRAYEIIYGPGEHIVE